MLSRALRKLSIGQPSRFIQSRWKYSLEKKDLPVSEEAKILQELRSEMKAYSNRSMVIDLAYMGLVGFIFYRMTSGLTNNRKEENDL